MKITIAPDSFKGSLDAYEVALAIKRGVLTALPWADVITVPIADGGEGTCDALINATGGRWVEAACQGPLLKPVTARYGILPTGTAVIEMASASGLTLIKSDERNPFFTTSRGFGELILDAVRGGCRELLLCIGGSATNDGGVGMLSALGFRFLKENGEEIDDGCIGLKDLKKIDTSGVLPTLSECKITVLCDVTNPLVGENGCSQVFAPQKGARPEDIPIMDGYLRRLASLTRKIYPSADENAAGTGAAGGVGFALMAYLGAVLTPGIDTVIKTVGLEEHVKVSDLVIVGEGRMDGQSAMGKAPVGVAKIAKKHGKSVIAIAGGLAEGYEECRAFGIDALFPAVRAPISLDAAMNSENAKINLEKAAREAIEAVKIGFLLQK